MNHQADEPQPRRRFLAIVNPISGRRDVSKRIEQIERELAEHGAVLTIKRTVGPGHAIEIAQVAHQDIDAILIVGGDGTVNEVLTGLSGSRVPLAIFPTGTENLIAKYRLMPRRPHQIARLLLYGVPVDSDLGLANGKVFAAVVGAGFDAECVQRLTLRRSGHISYLSYVLPIVQTFLKHRFPTLRVSVNSETVFEGRGLVIAGIIPRYAAGLRVLKYADSADGLIDVVVFRCETRSRLLRHAIQVAFRRHVAFVEAKTFRGAAGVIYAQGRQISIDSGEAVAVEIDGDRSEGVPLDLRTQPGSARFLSLPI